VAVAKRIRRAVRAVLLDPFERTLLVEFSFPERTVWACPGGGIEPGESDEQAIRRELAEEVGLVGFELGPCIWVREHLIPLFDDRWDGQAERFYLVRCEAFEPRPQLSTDELAREFVTDLRWWTRDELGRAGELFAPRRLPTLLRRLHEGEIGGEPIDAGV
jgi:ADP-ribose pyrophosphatase YjhB (NUDIX family)